MGRILSGLGHFVSYATDGVDALPKAKEVRPDLVLMDIVMPGMDGFRAMRALKEDPSTSNIPVVLVSTKNGDSDVFWGKKQGAADYVTKPFTEQSLIASVYRILGLSPPARVAAATPAAAPITGGAPVGHVQNVLDGIQKAFCRALGPFGKMQFKTELGNLGIAPEFMNTGHMSALISNLARAISDASARRDFETEAKKLV
jgi:twitching motility two-component system response regulator PilH